MSQNISLRLVEDNHMRITILPFDRNILKLIYGLPPNSKIVLVKIILTAWKISNLWLLFKIKER